MITISNMQGTLNTIYNHLLKQGCPSTISVPNGSYTFASCRYRGPNGTKCAIGCLIPDSEYVPQMENLIVPQLERDGYVQFESVQLRELCDRAQSIHDGYTDSCGDFGAYIRRRFTELAHTYSLTLPI